MISRSDTFSRLSSCGVSSLLDAALSSIGIADSMHFLQKSYKSYQDWLNCHYGVRMQGGRRKYQKNLQLVGWIRNDAIEEFCRRENAGNTGSGVGACTAKIKPANVLRDIVGSEPGTLGEDGFELKCGAHVGIEARFKVARGKD